MNVKVDFSINEIKREVRHLVEIGTIDRQQPIHTISQFFSTGEWALVECELEVNGYSPMTNFINELLDKN